MPRVVPGSSWTQGKSGANPAASQGWHGLGIRTRIRAGSGSSMAPGTGTDEPCNGSTNPGVVTVPSAPSSPQHAVASPGSLHLKKLVPPQNLQSRTRFPSRCQPGFLFAIFTGTSEGRNLGERQGHGLSAAHPAVSPPLLKELRLEPPGTVPKRPFLAPLHSWGRYQEPAEGGTQRAFLVLCCCGWILPQLPRNATAVRQSLALPAVLEEGWSWR